MQTGLPLLLGFELMLLQETCLQSWMLVLWLTLGELVPFQKKVEVSRLCLQQVACVSCNGYHLISLCPALEICTIFKLLVLCFLVFLVFCVFLCFTVHVCMYFFPLVSAIQVPSA